MITAFPTHNDSTAAAVARPPDAWRILVPTVRNDELEQLRHTMTAYDAAGSPAFGALLRSLRVAAGLSQAHLAARASVSSPMVARLELGQRWPSRPMVLTLARALDASADERDDLLAAAGLLPSPMGIARLAAGGGRA